MTSKKETWLGCRNGHAICIVRNSYSRELQSGAQQPGRLSWLELSYSWRDHKLSSFATGTACNLNLSRHRFWRYDLNRHNTRLGHTEALEAYCHRLRAQAAQGAGEFACPLSPRAP